MRLELSRVLAIKRHRRFAFIISGFQKAYKKRRIQLISQIIEILQTGNLRRIDYEKTEDVAVISLFQGIYGVGEFLIRPVNSPIYGHLPCAPFRPPHGI